MEPKKRGRPAKKKEETKVETKEVKLNAMGRPIKELPVYELTIKLANETYSSTGNSIEEALKNLEVPLKITTKGVVLLSCEGKKTERNFMPYEMKRFLYPISRSTMAKYLTITLK